MTLSHFQYATLSIIRFDLINELKSDLEKLLKNLAKFVRIVNQKKEEHAIIVKDEISTIWGDYLKHLRSKKYPYS